VIHHTTLQVVEAVGDEALIELERPEPGD
jgi:hypothetical protein